MVQRQERQIVQSWLNLDVFSPLVRSGLVRLRTYLPLPMSFHDPVQPFHSMLNHRELAGLIWIGVAILWASSKKTVREGSVGVVRAFLQQQVLIPLIAMLAWVGLELWVGVRLALWNPALAKGTILWTLGSAAVLLFNRTRIDSDVDDLHFFRRTILGTVCVTAFVEFFVNLYVMSLPGEPQPPSGLRLRVPDGSEDPGAALPSAGYGRCASLAMDREQLR